MALDYFLCPGEVKEIYGEKPLRLDVRFAYEDVDDIFPQYYKLYGQSAGLKSFSDGITLSTKGENPGEWITSKSPAKEELEKQGFKPTATLKFILPKVSYAGEYHIVTHSFHSIVKLNSSIEYIQKLFGRIQGLPLILVLEPVEAHIKINGVPSKKTVYTMRLHFEESEIMAFVKKRKEALAEMNETTPQLESASQEIDEDDDEDEIVA